MQKLKYKEHNLLYKVNKFSCCKDGVHYSNETVFYLDEPIIKKRLKYFLFGPIVTYNKYEKLFTLYYDIEDKRISESKLNKDLDLNF